MKSKGESLGTSLPPCIRQNTFSCSSSTPGRSTGRANSLLVMPHLMDMRAQLLVIASTSSHFQLAPVNAHIHDVEHYQYYGK